MKKILMILACCVVLCGCGNGHASEEQKNLNETEDGKENEVSVDLSGYEKITESVYIKNDLEAEIPTTYFFFQDAESSLQWRTFQFFMGEITRLEFEDFSVYVDCGDGEKKYSGKEMYAIESEEELYSMFPEEWRKYFGTSISKIRDIDMTELDTIIEEEIVKPLVEKYGENDSEQKEDSETEVLDEFSYEFDENNYVKCTLIQDSGSLGKNILMTITSNDEGFGFGVLCYMQSSIELSAKAEELNFAITLSNGGDSYGTIRKDGELSMIGDLDTENISTTEEQTDASIEFHDKLKEFLENNGFASLGDSETKENNREIFKDENIKIEFTGISGKENEYKVNFIIENLSGRTLIVQPRETSINGFMVDPICSMEIAPGKKIKDGMQIWNEDAETTPMSEVQNIEMKFHVFDDNDSSFRYDTENIIVMD